MSTPDDIVQPRSFLGVPVTGKIQHGDLPTQRPLSDLAPTMQAVVDDPTIHAFGWLQFTPYYNDGEPCVFRVRAPWFVTAEDVAAGTDTSGDDFDRDDYKIHSYAGASAIGSVSHRLTYDRSSGMYVPNPDAESVAKSDFDRFQRCAAFHNALGSGAFNMALLGVFGDYANVVLTRQPDGTMAAHVDLHEDY